MKVVIYFFVVFFFLTFANAQASYIRSPTPGTVVHRGKPFTVQIVRPNSIQGSTEVGLAIGLRSCADTSQCPPPSQQVGSVLYHGPFNPQLHELPGEPYENFTVIVPNLDFFNGKAQLNVERFHLIGAGPSPVLESHKVELKVSR